MPLLLALAVALLVVALVTVAPLDKRAWVRALEGVVARELPQLSPAARELLVAHAALESGFGVARAAVRGHNPFNVIGGRVARPLDLASPGQVTQTWPGEVWVDVGGDKDGQGRPITQVWRVYADDGAAVRGQWELLSRATPLPGLAGAYRAARDALVTGDVSSYAWRLHAAGYYELAPALYTAKLTAALAVVRAAMVGGAA